MRTDHTMTAPTRGRAGSALRTPCRRRGTWRSPARRPLSGHDAPRATSGGPCAALSTPRQQRAPPRKMISSSNSLPCNSEPECTSRQVKIRSTPAVPPCWSSENKRPGTCPGLQPTKYERVLREVGPDGHVDRGDLDQRVT